MPEPFHAGPVIRGYLEKGLYDRLPRTFSTFLFDRIRNWTLLFPAEQDYFERLSGLLDRSEAGAVTRLFAELRAMEERMGVNRQNWPDRQFTLAQVDFLQRSPHYPRWRAAVARIFSQIDPLLDQEVARRGRPRLVMVVSPSELPVGPDRMWTRIRERGRTVALAPPEDLGDYLPLLLTGEPRQAGAKPLTALYAEARPSAYEAWHIEAGDGGVRSSGRCIALSYQRLEPYRSRLMTEVRRMLDKKEIRGPQQLGAELKRLEVESSATGFPDDPVMTDFVRSTLLAGNGTLLLNNTFVEWSTLQAARRARPSVVVSSFGIRNKIKPFSSLLIYTDQVTANPIPTQMDMLGSYVDLEIFYLYIWQEFEKYAEYRNNTAYLFVGEGMEELLAIAPPDFPLPATGGPMGLRQVFAGMKEWLNL